MSDSSPEKSAEHNESPSTEVAGSSKSDPDRAESEWLEVEAVLSLPSLASGSDDVSPEMESAEARQPFSRFDPSTPLPMVETAFLASAASLIWLVNYYFPMGPLLRIFFPIPIALLYLRWGSRSAWMGTVVSGLLLSVLMGPARSILFVMPFGFMGVLLGVLWRRRASWMVSVGIGALLGAIGLFFRFWLVSLLLGDDLWLYATTQATDLLDWVFIKLGLLIQSSLWLVQAALVVMILLSNLAYLFVVHLVAWFLLDRLGTPIPRPPKWVQVLMDYE